MNKKVNKTTTRKEQLKLNSVQETAADNISQRTGDSAQRAIDMNNKKRKLTQQNPDLSTSQDGNANATDDDELVARQQANIVVPA